jgi:polyhydroxybutyrate depolymerase
MMRHRCLWIGFLSLPALVASRPAGARMAGVLAQAAEKTIAVDGHTRSYLVYAPRRGGGPLPLVLVFHGGGSDARRMERYSRFTRLAEREGFLVCYPQAVEGNWNDGRDVRFIRAHRDKIDDVKFVRRLIEQIGREHKLDRSRVFATGISNGAFMSHRLAAEASDLIAAVAPVVGGMAPAIAEKFAPKYPVSLFVIQGDRDPLVPIRGGYVGFRRGRRRGKLVPTKEAVAKYLRRNAISGKGAVKRLEDADPNDGTTTTATVYPAGLGGAKVRVYVVGNGGHAWPGRPLYLPEGIIGKASRDFDATRAIWEFFKSCPPRKPDRPGRQ